jgi:hypothetical protein
MQPGAGRMRIKKGAAKAARLSFFKVIHRDLFHGFF